VKKRDELLAANGASATAAPSTEKPASNQPQPDPSSSPLVDSSSSQPSKSETPLQTPTSSQVIAQQVLSKSNSDGNAASHAPPIVDSLKLSSNSNTSQNAPLQVTIVERKFRFI